MRERIAASADGQRGRRNAHQPDRPDGEPAGDRRSIVRRTGSPLLRVGAIVAMAAVVVGACGGRSGGTPTASSGAGQSSGASTAAGGGTVNIAINPWVGYEADAAVGGYLIFFFNGTATTEKNL